jgi:hypothetical protein
MQKDFDDFCPLAIEPQELGDDDFVNQLLDIEEEEERSPTPSNVISSIEPQDSFEMMFGDDDIIAMNRPQENHAPLKETQNDFFAFPPPPPPPFHSSNDSSYGFRSSSHDQSQDFPSEMPFDSSFGHHHQQHHHFRQHPAQQHQQRPSQQHQQQCCYPDSRCCYNKRFYQGYGNHQQAYCTPILSTSHIDEPAKGKIQDGTPISSLLQSSDRLLVTDFTNAVVDQMHVTSFSRRDRKGKRSSFANGYPGISCSHCDGRIGRTGRYFPSSIKTISDSKKSLYAMHKHINSCLKCPDEIKHKVDALFTKHLEERKSNKRQGTQRAYFRKIWQTLHPVEPSSTKF